MNLKSSQIINNPFYQFHILRKNIYVVFINVQIS